MDTNTRSFGSNFLAQGAYRKGVSKRPFLRKPLREEGGRWLKEGNDASEWVNLFYDLVVVAVLTVFSTGHEINRPAAIPIFLSFFSIINWIWSSQTHYDIRYQADDGWHTLAKGCQIMTFVFMGAAAGNWNPGLIFYGDTGTYSQANTSFTTVSVAFAVSRAFLAFQYVLSAWNGHRVGRKIQTHKIRISSLIISTIFSIIAAALPNNSKGKCVAKITLLYLGIGAELIAARLEFVFGSTTHERVELVGERHGAFTLIILGEGFISLTRAFNTALSEGSSNSVVYAQVFMSITIIYLLFGFLFTRFDPKEGINNARSAMWQILHFPLHFNLLLLLAALVNSVICFSLAGALTGTIDNFSSFTSSITNGTQITQSDQTFADTYLSTLHLQPSFEEEIQYLTELNNEDEPTDDFAIKSYQYLGQIMIQVFNSYEIEIEDSVYERYNELYEVNSTVIPDTEVLSERRSEAHSLLIEIIQEPSSATISGVLWLFPTAGIALILASLRSMLWYRYNGIAHYIVHLSWLLLGLILSLLGLLDIGNQNFEIKDGGLDQEFKNTNPMYHLVDARVPLVMVLVIYLIANYGTIFLLGIVHRIKGNVWSEEEEEEEETASNRV
ncbi:uncharacterized protein IL334_002304 [Kwoniella shivajii]|uniref:Low temperature requirement protein LtrA n=1 Tax=Kwoniella shivajii TaxID=564305 RepID=A0ABZ1CXD5_9TREE|nr:hypothetical protein IL334_002304 [Kwoniella shivajii]